MDLTDEDVRAIIRLVDACGFDELDLETDEFKLELRRSGAGWTREERQLTEPRRVPTPSAAESAESAVSALSAPSAPSATRSGAGAATTGRDAGAAGDVEVRSPLPGTFYRAPKPGAPPFVEVGSPVEPQTVVAIVETMKLMNSICAGAAGRVAEIGAQDGKMVIQGELLLRIRPDAPVRPDAAMPPDAP